ncbi:sugar phosphate isomerase/epimerase [Candidatus Woesearchaeota archaeon]|nr:sugar phosphate isomerase/epimerase [Candidatus Woesearchaeota archaeon]
MIFVSTACLKGINEGFEKDLLRVLELYKNSNIKNIELGSVHSEMEPDFLLKFLLKYKKENDANFIIHGFFPPIKERIMINIGSQNKNILEKSMFIVENAIELCRKLDARLYSFHSAALGDVDAHGIYITKKYGEKEVLETFEENLTKVCELAAGYGIKIAVENHGGECGDDFFARKEYFLNLFKKLKIKNLGILIDAGHLSAAARRFSFEKGDFIKSMQQKAFAVHCHENDGSYDQHKNVNLSTLKDFDKEIIKKTFIILEANSLSADEIASGINILQTFKNK